MAAAIFNSKLNNTTFIKAFNLFIRLGSTGSRFLLLLYIGRYFTDFEIGIYGIINSTIIIFYMYIGLDFYVYSVKEIIGTPKIDHLKILGNQLYLHVGLYILAIPFLWLILSGSLIPTEYSLYFCLLLILEHISQELYRLFTALEQALFANFILFIRQGAWIIVYVPVAYFYPSFNTLESIYVFWILGVLLANIIASYRLQCTYSFQSFPKVDYVLMIKGLRFASWFYASTVCYKIIEHSNRFFLEYFRGKEEVGVFVIFNQFSSLANIFVFNLVIMFLYPKLLYYSKLNDKIGFNLAKSKLKREVIKYSFATALFLSFLIFPLVDFFNKEVYEDKILVFYFLLIGNVFLNLSLVWHYALYSLGKHKQVFMSTIVGTLFNIVANIIFIPALGLYGAGIATASSFAIIFISKYYFFNKIKD